MIGVHFGVGNEEPFLGYEKGPKHVYHFLKVHSMITYTFPPSNIMNRNPIEGGRMVGLTTSYCCAAASQSRLTNQNRS